MRQYIVPVCECGGRNRIRCHLESTNSSAQHVGTQNTHAQNQNGSRESKGFEPRHVGSKPILLSTQSSRGRPETLRPLYK
jgi:hypothetical protein